MALLDGFKLIELKEKIEESTLTITAKSMRFNRGTARDLGLPGKVRFFVNEKLLQLAVTTAQDNDEDGVDFAFDESSREAPITVKEPAVLNTVKKLVVLEKEGQQTAWKAQESSDMSALYEFSYKKRVFIKNFRVKNRLFL